MIPKTISSLVATVIKESRGWHEFQCGDGSFVVFLTSEIGYQVLKDTVELRIISCGGAYRASVFLRFIRWDCSSMGKPDSSFKPFEIGDDRGKRIRKSVYEQEDYAAKIIGGERHVGSGAIRFLKSDASSDKWQVEAKQTSRKSITVSLEWLQKIQDEATTQQKHPMLMLRFVNIPEPFTVHKDWAVIPADTMGPGEQ